MNLDFLVLSTPAFWLVFIALTLFLFSIAISRSLSEITFSSQSKRLLSLLSISMIFAFSITLLSPIIASTFNALVNANQASEMALFAYSLIATLLVTYSLNVIVNFEKKEKEIVKKLSELNRVATELKQEESKIKTQVERLENISQSLMSTEQQHVTLIKSSRILSQLTLSRTSSYFSVVNQINELPLDFTDEDDLLRKAFMDLKLLQIAIGREDIDELCFDLTELNTLLQDEPKRINQIAIEPVQVYFSNLVKYYEDIKVDQIKLDRLSKLVTSFHDIKRLN